MLPGLLIYSCYWSPAGSIKQFELFLSDFGTDIRLRLRPDIGLVVARD